MKRLHLYFILTTLLIMSSLSIAVTLSSMTKIQFEKAFTNKTYTSIGTDNLNGHTIDNTFSMFLDGQGNIWGKMAIKPENEPQMDRGVYSIKKDGTFYITWQHWDGAKTLCGHVFETKNAYISIDCNNVFHTAFMKNAVQTGNRIK